MLVLTRKSQERIRIGDNITISILKVKGNAVSVGIEAPREVRVVRAELPLITRDVTESHPAEPSEATTTAGSDEEPSASGAPQSLQRFIEERRGRRDAVCKSLSI